jgi:hypothetical protein
MPKGQDIDEIISQFEQDAKAESMNPATMRVVSDRLRQLGGEQHPEKAAQLAYDLMADLDTDPSVGRAVCSTLLSRQDGGHQIATAVCKQAVQNELQKAGPNAEGGFLRASHTVNGFSKEYLNQTAPTMGQKMKDDVANVREEVYEEVMSYTNKVKPFIEERDRLQGEINKLSNTKENAEKNKEAIDQLVILRDEQSSKIDEFKQEREDLQIKIARKQIPILSQPPPSKEAQSFLRAMREGIRETPGFKESYIEQKGGNEEKAEQVLNTISDNFSNNNTALRFTSPAMVTDPKLGSNPLWKESSQLALASFNRYSDEDGESIKTTEKISRNAIEKVHTDDMRETTKGMHQTLDNAELQDGMDIDLQAKSLETSDERNLKFQQDKVQLQRDDDDLKLQAHKPELDKIKAMEKKLDQLKSKPTLWDKIKAIPQGGIEKAREKLLDKIDQAKLEVMQKMDPAQFKKQQEQNKGTVAKLKEERDLVQGQAQKFDEASKKIDEIDGAVNINEGVKGSDLGELFDQKDLENLSQQRKQAVGVMKDNVQGAREHQQHDAEVKQLEKNMTNREKLGSTIGKGTQGQSTGNKVK